MDAKTISRRTKKVKRIFMKKKLKKRQNVEYKELLPLFRPVEKTINKKNFLRGSVVNVQLKL